jgi:glycine cleavage system H protein
VTGTVLAVNGDLDDHPGLANEDPYHEGWLVEVEVDDDDELDSLMATDEYETFVAQRDEE